MKQNRFLLALLSMTFIFSACEKDDGEGNDEEVITTLSVKLTPVGGGATSTFSFDDPDGPGGIAPTVDAIQLAANTVYNVSLELFNKTLNPPANLTTEISGEAEAHRFYFEPSASGNIQVTGLDLDGANIPLGLNSVWSTGNAANGTMKIVLRHYSGNPPNKAVSDPVNSNKSSTDIEVTFNTVVN
ncbi:MAG: hypothetical protein H0U44_04600 [Flavisolibacter sp.]|jgi:hypothetical protein|nr:hypothetical protein [Flavisolibacter sp.]